ncbi:hypothetical protein KB20921_27420 [Edwardsiella ictaluri]|uniref:Uncharacterized protein n=1 Tax=Edwardsiella ictaluri (strain 93-146) TaxID=634503 RepID=C5BAN1_EDWI9|nr:hypothetical protein NT01EI_3088 [Edwardsiella ictaluri 93-146]BEI00002.1 hypothetical protein KH20906_27290 [Edwardsiella ictaluri]BEI03481.1 hypothetical protein KB20921_27420 [Edwardsiella ictaluri]BEI06942.1 hypothetical protein KH201010_27280 [Edwardsiella ictaluri]BEI10411.1 hypothetical protein STU22726_27420 [Edwardsiella ictaluri]
MQLAHSFGQDAVLLYISQNQSIGADKAVLSVTLPQNPAPHPASVSPMLSTGSIDDPM